MDVARGVASGTMDMARGAAAGAKGMAKGTVGAAVDTVGATANTIGAAGKGVLKMGRKAGRLDRNHVELPLFELGFTFYERFTPSFFKASLVEFMSTTLFLFIATGSVCFTCHVADTNSNSNSSGSGSGVVVDPVDCLLGQSRVQGIATVFGVTIFVLVYFSAAFSGGHLNPAVTFAFLISGKVTLTRAVAYWVAQILGAILGSAFVYAVDINGFQAASGGTNRLLTGINRRSGWLMEVLLTFTLILVVFIATDKQRGQATSHLPVLAPLSIGFTVYAAHLAAVPLDGCSINPARSFGPAVISGVWIDQWVFWVGPLCGSLLAVLTYETLLRPSGYLPRQKGQKGHPGQTGIGGFSGATGLQEGDDDDDEEAVRRTEEKSTRKRRDSPMGHEADNQVEGFTGAGNEHEV